ncbi:hypothetical protein [Streptomyces antarcticus]|uniref:hypothetical protein n=1 Tax=Streptomyces antarcticus TaxID=2996458 RepID=UPI002271C705|nr:MULTISPECIES: hypothetical protein [unclassified Streptomyces]MCY0946521.1 hypothetical protein [Streptomyces sp. H34-AA3]MCZ4087490.1 hypothetical protein [Streptomyces sp. H34-S5]
MTDYPGFGALLAQLFDHKGVDAGALARRAGVLEPELEGVLAGVMPSPLLLRQLGPALGLHAEDVFVIAGATIPVDLTPLDADARKWVPRVVKHAVGLPPEKRGELLHLVRSLPQHECVQSPPFPQLCDPPVGPPGALLVRMLRHRNLDWTGMAKTFLLLTGRYWSASTYGMVGAGRKALTADLVADFGTVLGVPAGDLAALTGTMLSEEPPSPEPAAVDMAELIWDLRRLTAGQVQRVSEAAASMQRM